MPNHYISIFNASVFLMLLSTLVSWIFLKLICYSNQNFLSFIYISSGKSSTNARLLGGLAVSASSVSTIASLLIFYSNSLSQSETRIFIAALISILFVTLYGYIDDKFEVRVRFKLSLQFIAVLSFAYFSSSNISHNYPTSAFIFSFIFGLALINGTNLLDGLDTLSIKLGIPTSLAFLYLGVIANSSATIYLSVILISALIMFYFFNREPAKVYMGEIGGSIIGLIYYIQASICLSELRNQMSFSSAFALVSIAGLFPIFELGISFLRRILSKKSPFVGDRLHLHYVIKNKYRLTASEVSTRMGISSAIILSFGFLLANSYNSILAVTFVIMATAQCYLWVCMDEWRSINLGKNIHSAFNIFEGRTIKIIDATQFNGLDVTLKEDAKQNFVKKKSA